MQELKMTSESSLVCINWNNAWDVVFGLSVVSSVVFSSIYLFFNIKWYKALATDLTKYSCLSYLIKYAGYLKWEIRL